MNAKNEKGRIAALPSSTNQNTHPDSTNPDQSQQLVIEGHPVNPKEQVAVFELMSKPEFFGATQTGWEVMSRLVGTQYLLPTVCNPHLWNSRGFVVKDSKPSRVLAGGSFGKTPCAIDSAGKLHGFKGWTTKTATSIEINDWSKNRDLGILVRTAHARALDIDAEREDTVSAILAVVESHFGPERWAQTPIRFRENSARKTLLFIVAGDIPSQSVPLRQDLCDPNATKPEAFELLANGRQTLWAGTHPSGARLQHRNLNTADGASLPVLSMTEAKALWADLALLFAADPDQVAQFGEGRSTSPVVVAALVSDDPVARYMTDIGLVRGTDKGLLHVDCPWQEHHTGGATPVSSASWLLPFVDAKGATQPGRFKCMHSGCGPHGSARRNGETSYYAIAERFKEAIGFRDAEIASAFPAVAQPAPAPAAPAQPATAQPSGKRYKLKRYADILATTKPMWLVHNVLPSAGLAAIYGASGSGKSFLAMHLGLAIAGAADEWFGHRVKEHRPVVYLCLEGAAGVKLRLAAYDAHYKSEPPDQFTVISEEAFNLATQADTAELIQSIRSEYPKGAVVIIDTLNRAAEGVDENSGKEMTALYAQAMQIQQALNGLVIIVTHTGKDESKGVRGHSSQFAALDCAIAVSRNGEFREWKLAKSKDGEDGIAAHFKLESKNLGDDPDGEPVSSVVVVELRGQAGQKSRHKPNDDLAIRALQSATKDAPGVVLEVWKTEFLKLHTGDNPDSKRRGFANAQKALLASGLVTESGGVYRWVGDLNPGSPF
jgi:hypothetical protein